MTHSPQKRQQLIASATFIVEQQTEHGQRLDKTLAQHTKALGFSRERIKRFIKNGACTIDGQPCIDPKTILRTGQHIHLNTTEHETSPLIASANNVEIIQTDGRLALINKPINLTVHPCPSCTEETLVHRLLGQFPQLQDMEGLRPGIVHRLDKDTSGVMLVALDSATQHALSNMFITREIHKTYLALVHGCPPKEGECTEPIGRHPTNKVKMSVRADGRPAHTEWQTLYTDPQQRFALLAVRIHTGRTHQIRVHLSHLGYPLLGDKTYGNKIQKSYPQASRQMLHAWHIAFNHPHTKEALKHTCPPPKDMQETFCNVAQATSHVIITGVPACGKSHTLQTLANMGYHTWNADSVVHELYKPGNMGWQALHTAFGSRFFKTDQTTDTIFPHIDKQKLLQAMQKEPETLHTVNAIIHPLVYNSLQEFFIETEKKNKSMSFAEVPLWFETKHLYPFTHTPYIIVVHSPNEIRHARLKTLRNWSEKTIATMDAWQWSAEKKRTHADHGIINDGTLEKLTAESQTLPRHIEENIIREHAKFRRHFSELTKNPY